MRPEMIQLVTALRLKFKQAPFTEEMVLSLADFNDIIEDFELEEILFTK